MMVLSRYVEFNEKNFECFSIEMARILLAAGAEVDVVCKQLCRTFDPNSKANSINNYQSEITSKIPGIPAFEVTVPRFGLTLHSWDAWATRTVPIWWTGYNKVKHHRDSHYGQANLKNALNAVAGLFVVTVYLYKGEAEKSGLWPARELFSVARAHSKGSIAHGSPIYRL